MMSESREIWYQDELYFVVGTVRDREVKISTLHEPILLVEKELVEITSVIRCDDEGNDHTVTPHSLPMELHDAITIEYEEV